MPRPRETVQSTLFVYCVSLKSPAASLSLSVPHILCISVPLNAHSASHPSLSPSRPAPSVRPSPLHLSLARHPLHHHPAQRIHDPPSLSIRPSPCAEHRPPSTTLAERCTSLTFAPLSSPSASLSHAHGLPRGQPLRPSLAAGLTLTGI